MISFLSHRHPSYWTVISHSVHGNTLHTFVKVLAGCLNLKTHKLWNKITNATQHLINQITDSLKNNTEKSCTVNGIKLYNDYYWQRQLLSRLSTQQYSTKLD